MVTELKRIKESWDYECLDTGEGTNDVEITYTDYQHKRNQYCVTFSNSRE